MTDKKLPKLTDKQEMFCKEYIVDLNATQAAIRAGYSEKTAKEQGCQNLTKLNIHDRLAVLKAKRSEKVEVQAEDILKHLDILRNSNIKDYIEIKTIIGGTEENPVNLKIVEFKDFSELTEEQLMCIDSVKNTAHGIELKLHGKNWTIDQINKHIGFYEKDNKLNLTGELPPSIVMKNMHKEEK